MRKFKEDKKRGGLMFCDSCGQTVKVKDYSTEDEHNVNLHLSCFVDKKLNKKEK